MTVSVEATVNIFLYILMNNIAPVFILIFLGFILGKKFKLDIYSFSKIIFFIYVPALAFVKLYETKIEAEHLKALLYAVIYLAVLVTFSTLFSRLRKHSTALGGAFQNSILLYNSANFGLPLITLVFKDSPYAAFAVSLQIMVLLVQNISTNTIGLFNAGRSRLNIGESLKTILKMPAIYTIAAALLLKCVPLDLTKTFVWPAIVYLKDGMVSMALVTLGIQLSKTKFEFKHVEVYLATFARLLIGPALAFVTIYLMNIHGIMAQVLLISSSVPTAVNAALIAVELDNEKDFSSQVVMTTTLLSAVTLTLVIYLSTILFKV